MAKEMKSLSILLGTAVIALSTMATSNVAVAGGHMKTYEATKVMESLCGQKRMVNTSQDV